MVAVTYDPNHWIFPVFYNFLTSLKYFALETLVILYFEDYHYLSILIDICKQFNIVPAWDAKLGNYLICEDMYARSW